jgi:hypothetical protein
MSGRGAALGGEREVAPLRRLEVEHGGSGHLEFGRTVAAVRVMALDSDRLLRHSTPDIVQRRGALLTIGDRGAPATDRVRVAKRP